MSCRKLAHERVRPILILWGTKTHQAAAIGQKQTYPSQSAGRSIAAPLLAALCVRQLKYYNCRTAY